jgi:pimeloyl-ACP methyl ester carboxylesterase
MRASHTQGDEQIRALWRHARGFANSHDDMCFTPPQLGTIKARTRIVYGDRDPLYPVEMAVEMYRAIPGASLCVVPGGGHGPIFAGEAKDHFVRSSLAFLDGAP